MKLKCSNCGAEIVISPQATAEGRVVCGGCNKRYRLKPKATQTTPSPRLVTATDLPTQHPTTQGSTTQGSTTQGPTTQGPTAAMTPPPPPKTVAPPPPPTEKNTGQQQTGQEQHGRDDQPTFRLPSTGSMGSTPPLSTPAPPAADTPAFAQGALLAGRYRIVKFLAKGGMGEVYESEDIELRERVALKTIRGQDNDEKAIDRFKREIYLARKVTHPNVCRIFDLGRHVGEGGSTVTFLTMELLHGMTLTSRLREQGRLAADEALPIAKQIAAALDAAHRAQIVHRDLKSENIFLVQENGELRTVVTDFGIARGGREDRFAALVTGADIVGTPAYMAPEQVEGLPVTPAADLYAFGVVLYEMVTGVLPFTSDNPITTAAKRLREKPAPPRIHVPDLDPRWEKTILRCLERQPENRFASATEAVEVLGASPSSTPTAAARPQPVARPAAPAAQPDKATTGTLYGVTMTARPKGEIESIARTRKLLSLLAAIAVMAAGLFVWNQINDDQVVPRRSVAVLGLDNLGTATDDNWLGTAVAEMLETELSQADKLRTISGDRVGQLRQEMALAQLKDLDQQGLLKVRGLLGCDYVVTGSFLVGGDQLRIDLRLLDAVGGSTLAAFDRQGNEADLFNIVRGLGDDLREHLGGGQTTDPAQTGQPQNREAARLYSQGLSHLRRSSPREARDALVAAALAEPQNPRIQSALAVAWQALGYGERAAEAASSAYQQSEGLPREDRLVIEGRYFELNADWASAVEIYTNLLADYPDNLEYGLRLAGTLNASHDPVQAMETIEKLRQLPEPLSQDPRIDLAEAEAAAALADYERQLNAARQAVARAQTIDSTLFKGQGHVAAAQALLVQGEAAAAAEEARKGRSAYASIDHTSGAALALTAEANALYNLSKLDEASNGFTEARDIYRQLGREGDLAASLNNLAMVHKKKGDLSRATHLYEDVEEIYNRTNDQLGLANTENNKAAVLVLRDDLTTAEAMFKSARERWQEAGDRNLTAYATSNLAAVLRLTGDLPQSDDLGEIALETRREIGNKIGEIYSLAHLGGVAAEMGDLGKAAARLAEAQELAEVIQHPASRAQLLFELAELELMRGDPESAKKLHEEALAAREGVAEGQAAESQLALAKLAYESGDDPTTVQLAQKSRDIFRLSQRPADEASAAALMALSLLRQGRTDAARLAAKDALNLGAASRQVKVRLWVALADAATQANEGQHREALRILEDLNQELMPMPPLSFEVRLLQAQIEMGIQKSTARTTLENLRAEATVAGFAWISQRAANLLIND